MGFTNHNHCHSRQFGILHWNVWFWDQMWGEFWRFRYQTWCNIGIYHGTLESKGYCNDHDGWLLWFSESLHWSYDSPIHNKEIWPWNMGIFLTNLSTVFSRVWKNWDHRGNWDDTFTIEISRYTSILVGAWATPLKKYEWTSIGLMSYSQYFWENKKLMATIHHQPAIDFPCDQGQFSQRYGDTMGIISWEYYSPTTKVTVTKTTVVTVYDLGLLATEELIRFRVYSPSWGWWQSWPFIWS